MTVYSYTDKTMIYEQNCEECGKKWVNKKTALLIDEEGIEFELVDRKKETETKLTRKRDWWQDTGIRPDGLCNQLFK